MGLGVLADALSGANHVVEGDVDQAAVEVEVADLQAAQVGRVGLEPTTGGL
jgi:hypothetical protein